MSRLADQENKPAKEIVKTENQKVSNVKKIVRYKFMNI